MVLDNRSGLIWAYLTVAYATLFFSAIFHWETQRDSPAHLSSEEKRSDDSDFRLR
jgi:hypothetical protein